MIDTTIYDNVDDARKFIIEKFNNDSLVFTETNALVIGVMYEDDIVFGDKYIIVERHQTNQKDVTYFEYNNDGLELDIDKVDNIDPDVELNMFLLNEKYVEQFLKEYDIVDGDDIMLSCFIKS